MVSRNPSLNALSTSQNTKHLGSITLAGEEGVSLGQELGTLAVQKANAPTPICIKRCMAVLAMFTMLAHSWSTEVNLTQTQVPATV